MKHMYRYTLLALCTTMAHAQEDVRNTAVYLDSPGYRFETQFRALIFKPTSGNLSYAAQATPLPIQSPSWNIYAIHPDYSFGFDLSFAGTLHNENTRLAFNWQHFTSCSCAAHQVPVDTDMVGPFFAIGPDTTQYKSAAGTVRFTFNNANATYGQMVYCGDLLQTTLFVGIDVSQIKQCLTATYTADSTVYRTIRTPTTFLGAGPEIGVNFHYDIAKGLQLAGQFSAAVLAGSITNFTSYTSVTPELEEHGWPSPNNQTTCTQKSTQIVPDFAQRLGLAYTHEYREHYMIQLEVGYEARVYVGALQTVDLSSEVITLPNDVTNEVGVFARTFHKTFNNFALSGPYVSIDLGF